MLTYQPTRNSQNKSLAQVLNETKLALAFFGIGLLDCLARDPVLAIVAFTTASDGLGSRSLVTLVHARSRSRRRRALRERESSAMSHLFASCGNRCKLSATSGLSPGKARHRIPSHRTAENGAIGLPRYRPREDDHRVLMLESTS